MVRAIFQIQAHTAREAMYEKIMFVLAGASVEIPHKVYKALGYLGPKLYFLRLTKGEGQNIR